VTWTVNDTSLKATGVCYETAVGSAERRPLSLEESANRYAVALKYITFFSQALPNPNHSCIFIVTPCMLSSYSTNTQTNALIYNLHIKTLKLLRHVSVLRPSSGSYIVLAKVTLKIVTD